MSDEQQYQCRTVSIETREQARETFGRGSGLGEHAPLPMRLLLPPEPESGMPVTEIFGAVPPAPLLDPAPHRPAGVLLEAFDVLCHAVVCGDLVAYTRSDGQPASAELERAIMKFARGITERCIEHAGPRQRADRLPPTLAEQLRDMMAYIDAAKLAAGSERPAGEPLADTVRRMREELEQLRARSPLTVPLHDENGRKIGEATPDGSLVVVTDKVAMMRLAPGDGISMGYTVVPVPAVPAAAPPGPAATTPSTDPVCSCCSTPLLFSARQRGDGKCGPCSRAASGVQGLADRARAAGVEPSIVLEILRSPEGRAAIAEVLPAPDPRIGKLFRLPDYDGRVARVVAVEPGGMLRLRDDGWPPSYEDYRAAPDRVEPVSGEKRAAALAAVDRLSR